MPDGGNVSLAVAGRFNAGCGAESAAADDAGAGRFTPVCCDLAGRLDTGSLRDALAGRFI